MTITIGTEKVKARVYVTGNTYAVRDRLKSAGCHWDAQRKQWWIGAAKSDKIESIVGKLDGKEVKEDLSRKPLLGKASYKGRDYYVLATTPKNGGKLWLTVLDGSIDFWAATDACRWVKRYDPDGYRQTTLTSIRAFVAEKKREEVEAKEQAAKVTAAAQGEPTRDIPRLTDARIIRGFFGDRAVEYDYEVTDRDWDEYDNEAPGHYYGVTVPVLLAERWDAGVIACKNAGVETRSREGLLIRYRLMVANESAELPAELAELASAKEAEAVAKQAAKDAAAAKQSAEKAEVEALLDGLVQCSVGPTAPKSVSVKIDGEECGHHMASTDPGDCTFEKSPCIDRRGGKHNYGSTYTRGVTADGQTVVRMDSVQYDDYRTYYYAPQSIATLWLLAAADARGITLDDAVAHQEKYSGCHGADLYQAVVDRG